MKRADLKAELAERADLPPQKAWMCLNEIGHIFLDWLADEQDTEFPLGYVGIFVKEKKDGQVRVKYRPSKKAMGMIEMLKGGKHNG